VCQPVTLLNPELSEEQLQWLEHFATRWSIASQLTSNVFVKSMSRAAGKFLNKAKDNPKKSAFKELLEATLSRKRDPRDFFRITDGSAVAESVVARHLLGKFNGVKEDILPENTEDALFKIQIEKWIERIRKEQSLPLVAKNDWSESD
jgi:hypothetical protein